MGRSLAIHLTRQVAIRLMIVVAIVLGVFLAENIPGPLETVVETRSNIMLLFAFLALRAPRVLDIALPIGLLAATYGVVLAMREQREMMALAAAGISGCRILALLFGFAAICQALVLITSGFIEPYARYAERLWSYSMQHRLVQTGLTANQFYSLGAYTLYAEGRGQEGMLHNVFIFRSDKASDEEKQTLMTATAFEIADAPRREAVTLRLHEVSSDTFRIPSLADYKRSAVPEVGAGMDATEYRRMLLFDDFFEFVPRIRHVDELTFGELLDGADKFTEATARLARSLLCLMAVPIALLALFGTRAWTRSMALPIACGMLLLMDVMISVAIVAYPPQSLWQVGLELGVGALLVVVLGSAALVATRGSGIIKPQLVSQ